MSAKCYLPWLEQTLADWACSTFSTWDSRPIRWRRNCCFNAGSWSSKFLNYVWLLFILDPNLYPQGLQFICLSEWRWYYLVKIWNLPVYSLTTYWMMLILQLESLEWKGLREDLIYFGHSLLLVASWHLVLIGQWEILDSLFQFSCFSWNLDFLSDMIH